jgi:hypothetical protein
LSRGEFHKAELKKHSGEKGSGQRGRDGWWAYFFGALLLLLGGRAFGGSLLLPVVEGLFGDHLLSVEDRPVLIFGCKRGKKRKRDPGTV